MTKKLEIEKTNRGFAIANFTDRYGAECSLQKSSLASEDAIWFGINDANPLILASDAHRLGIPTTANNGWVEYKIPKEVLISTRMHLTQDMVIALLPYLKRFVKTGEL